MTRGTRTWIASAWLAAVAAALVVFLLILRGDSTEPPGSTVIPFPTELTAEQRERVLELPNPDSADPSEPLARLVSWRDVTSEEAERTIASDAAFAELVAFAAGLGYGERTGAFELHYDNGVVATVLAYPTRETVVQLAFRWQAEKSAYLLASLDPEKQLLTARNREGTVSVNFATGETTEEESPLATHSCSFTHCFVTAMKIVGGITGYGDLVKLMCTGALLCVPFGGPTCLAWPPVYGCVALILAALGASAFVCIDDPCDLCSSNSCGEVPTSTEVHCAWLVGDRDPVTGVWASLTIVNYGYTCTGIERGVVSDNYRGTQCQYWSQSGGIIQGCPYGCSADGLACAEQQTCDPATCDRTEASGEPVCEYDASEGAFVLREQSAAFACMANGLGGQACTAGATTTEVIRTCPAGCSADGAACAASATATPTATRTPTRTPILPATQTPLPGTVSGTVLEAKAGGGYQACAGCRIRLTRGTIVPHPAVTDSAGHFAVAGVATGNYRVQRLCGSSWNDATQPFEDSTKTYGNLNSPRTSNLDVLFPYCSGGR